MMLNPLYTIVAILVIALSTGCAQHYPEVEPDFEQNWQSQTYQSQAYLIPTAGEAYARRLALVRSAQQHIDITYFSWDKDTSGLLLLEELRLAADRGVKVRLTLDDLLLFNEKWLAGLNQHPNIAIKVFNPFHSRKLGWIGRAVDFASHQRQRDNRLHEKYFNIDGQWLILGGRNIGDAYFGFSQQANFFDMDTLFKGDIIRPFARNYDTLWHSEHLQDISSLIAHDHQQPLEEFEQAIKKHTNKAVIAHIEEQVEQLSTIDFIDVKATPVFDSLAKLNDNKPYFRTRAEHTIDQYLNKAKSALISTPYMVPSQGEFTVVDKLVANQAQVTLLTNSSASNDSGFIPAYYEQHRITLLNKGVDIFEYKANASNDDHFYHADTYYHNKTLILDSQLSYIGSSNFDPRSDFLNIEFGVFVDSTQFAQQVEHYLLRQQTVYWHVSLDKQGKPQWQSADEIHHDNPDYGKWHEIPNWLFRKMHGEFEL